MNINGIVANDIICEISAIPAAFVVSFPNALGTTMVLRPRGIAREHKPHIKIPRDIGTKYETPINNNGSTTRRTADIR